MWSRTWKSGYGPAIGIAILAGIAGVGWPAMRGVAFFLLYVTVSLGILAAIGVFRGLDQNMQRATTLFFLLKIAMAVLSLVATTVVFAGAADALSYSHAGATIAFDWKIGIPPGNQSYFGTDGMNLIVAHLYSISVPNKWFGFLVFSWTSAIGTMLIWHGVARDWPYEVRRRFGIALMFLPSLLYWTSPISKEAIVILGMGLLLTGVSYIFKDKNLIAGLLLLISGGLVTLIVRPNITLLLLVSLVAALLIPWSRWVKYRPSSWLRVIAIVIILVALVPVVAANRQLLHLSPGQGFVQGSLDTAQNESAIGGGSAFATTSPSSITGIPASIISVLFRPFPWEVRTPLQVAASIEGMILAIWAIRIGIRWRRKLIRPRVDGMMIMSLIYLLLFCIAFSSIGNFGLLVRERVQALPFLLIVFSSFESRIEAVEAEIPFDRNRLVST